LSGQATLFNVQRFSTEDGPGIRTTLFFKGCPLRCPWCHNPEGLRRQPEIVRCEVDCVGCGDCLKACPNGALERRGDAIALAREKCKACGACVEACGPAAIERVGRSWTSAELLAEVLKDRTFYETSSGGITLSGGEPLLWHSFLREFLPAAREAGLHVALDTCGAFPEGSLDQVLAHVSLVLLDIKLLDDERHRELTGAGVHDVLGSAEAAARRNIPMWIRTPVIPGCTDGEENIRGIARLIRQRLPAVERYDLLAFSNLCRSKYRRLGMRFEFERTALMGRERMEHLADVARSEGAARVTWSGPTAD